MIAHHRRIVAWLEDHGVTEIELDWQHRHLHVHFLHNGSKHTLVTSATPSDTFRATANAISNLRHMMGLVEPKKRVGPRRVPRVRAAACKAPLPKITAGRDWRCELPKVRAGVADQMAAPHPAASPGPPPPGLWRRIVNWMARCLSTPS